MKFPAKEYLKHYYKEIVTENQKLIEFYANHKDRIPLGAKHLEIAGGPTIYQVISISPRTSEIVYTDISIAALNELKSWVRKSPRAFNWDNFIKKCLELEGLRNDQENVDIRAEIIRKKIKRFIKADLSLKESIKNLAKRYGRFQSISSNFAFEAFTFSRSHFKRILKEFYDILENGGTFNIIMVENCRAYQIGSKYFKTLNIDKNDLLSILIEVGFSKDDMVVEFQDTENDAYGYSGIMLISCKKRENVI